MRLSRKLRRKPAAPTAPPVEEPKAPPTAPEPEEPKAPPTSFDLADIHPESTLVVMTDVARDESGFTTGAQLREFWQSSKIQRVGTGLAKDPPGNWCHVRCPDGLRMFVKFTSTRHQLLAADDETAGQSEETNMATLKKTSAKTVKPVAAAAKKKPGAASTPKPPKPAGTCKWLLDRLKAQAARAFSTDANRGVIKSGVASCESYSGVKRFLAKAGAADDAKFEQFLETFFGHTINR
jgi:hypothetical protein